MNAEIKKMEVEEEPKKKFHMCKKSYFLTYSQCELEKKDVGEFLISKGAEVVVVAQEHHKDNGLHLHAWCEWPKKKDVVNPRYFDFRGVHCSIGDTKKKRMQYESQCFKIYIKRR